MRRLLCGLLAAVTLSLTVGLDLAAADPSSENPQALARTIACDNDQTYDIVVVAAGAPGHLVEATGNVILTAAAWEETFTDPVTGDLVTQSFGPFPVGQGQRTGQHADLVSCTYQFTYEDAMRGTVQRTVTVEAFLTPRGA